MTVNYYTEPIAKTYGISVANRNNSNGQNVQNQRNLSSMPSWLGTTNTILNYGSYLASSIRTAGVLFKNPDLYMLMRMDGRYLDFPGGLSKGMLALGWGVSILDGIMKGYDTYANGGSISDSIISGTVRTGIGVGIMYGSVAVVSSLMSVALTAGLMNCWNPVGVVILGACATAALAYLATELVTEVKFGDNTIEGYLNDFFDWLVFWD